MLIFCRIKIPFFVGHQSNMALLLLRLPHFRHPVSFLCIQVPIASRWLNLSRTPQILISIRHIASRIVLNLRPKRTRPLQRVIYIELRPQITVPGFQGHWSRDIVGWDFSCQAFQVVESLQSWLQLNCSWFTDLEWWIVPHQSRPLGGANFWQTAIIFKNLLQFDISSSGRIKYLRFPYIQFWQPLLVSLRFTILTRCWALSIIWKFDYFV